MAIDVFGLRDDKKLKFTSVASIRDIYANPTQVLSQIPHGERWNIYFNLASDNTQDFLPVNINNVRYQDMVDVIDIACQRFRVEPGQVLSSQSGFGVQILIPLKTPIEPAEYTNGYFKDREVAYKNILSRIGRDLVDEGLSGEPNPDMFQRDWWARMPETLNIKGAVEGRAQIINNVSEPVDIDLSALDSETEFDKLTSMMGTLVTASSPEEPSPLTKTKQPKQKIATEGFRDIYIDMQGKKQLSKIRYYDLVKHFEKEHLYKTIEIEGTTYVFDKTHYKLMTRDRVFEYVIKNTFDSNRNDRSEVFSIIQASNITPRSWFIDSAHKKINFKNGVLDLRTKKLLPHSTEYGFFYCLPYAYDPEATCPTFDQHIKDITCDDEDLQSILLEFMGYAVSNDEPWAQRCLFLTGEGNNGKSTFINILKGIVGPGSYSTITIDNLENQQILAGIEGKLFNLSEEGPNQLYRSGIFKRAVAGQEETVKRLYVQPYSVFIRAKMIVTCNELPKSPDTTHGFFRRFLIVPFDRKFTAKDEDPFINRKLATEHAGILNKILIHYEKLLERKDFTYSEKSLAVTKEFMETNDAIRDWLSNCEYSFTDSDKDFVSTLRLYESYRRFCLHNTHKIDTKRVFAKKLRQIDKNFKAHEGAVRRVGNGLAKGVSHLRMTFPAEIDTIGY